MLDWLALGLAGLLEIAWTLGLKYTDGFTRPWPSMGTALAIALSFGFFAISLRSVPFGTAYAVWIGIGAAGTASIGIVMFDEPAGLLRVLCLGLIVAGAVGLKLATD